MSAENWGTGNRLHCLRGPRHSRQFSTGRAASVNDDAWTRAKPAKNSNELRSALWDAAEILRGSAVDRTDWKGYILPLLFFKRICDVYDEETAEATEEFGDADPVYFPEVHQFTIPEGAHWRDVRETAANVGAALSHAMREIELGNPDTLYRVFGTADWGNREILTDE